MKVNFYDYPLQFRARGKEYIDIIKNTLEKGSYVLGSEVEIFEERFAEFVGSRNAIGVGNCTDGLLLCLYALGIGKGDEIITVAHTFVATVEVIIAVGAKPVFADIADDHNMDIDHVKKLMNKKTKAIIPVQLNGRICSNMEELVNLAYKNDVFIIEDAAQALGAKYKGKCAGTFGTAGCFSFYPAKLLGAFGDAGAIVTDEDRFSEILRKMRDHGRSKFRVVELWGLNSRMDSIHAAILTYKLKLVEKWIERRREIARIYHEGLSGIEEIKLPPPPLENDDHYDVFQNYEIEAENRDELRRHCEINGIETALPWGGKGVHQFKGLGLENIKLPRTDAFFSKSLLLPIYPDLSNDQVYYVIETIRGFYC
jgi:dTDP-4-amino-4,6-dideoxygalactose transaminase